jgi:CHRD domain-containing protein
VSTVEAFRGIALAGLTVALVGCSSGTTAPTFTAQYFTAALTPANEVPTGSGSATGTANLGTTSATQISYSVSGQSLSNVTGVYIYKGASGANATGNPEVTICTTTCISVPSATAGSIATGTLDSTKVSGAAWSDFLSQLGSGGAYVQIKTSGAPSGAVRGQVNTSSSPPNDPFFVL